jgi:hypothetical protein
LYHGATDLEYGDALPDGDEVARYCKPSALDQDSKFPTFLAFMRRENEDGISVNRLQYFRGLDRTGAISYIRPEVERHYEIKPTGRFLALNVLEAKSAAQGIGFDIGIIYTPRESSPSHSSIVDLPEDYVAEVRVATAILRLISQVDIYLAMP